MAVVAEPEMQQAKAVSDATMDQLAEQIRANLIRNVAEAASRPAGDPADWEI
jgi:deoxyxylulose-5-phosphate synthase